MPNQTQIKKRNAQLVSHRESLGLSLRQYANLAGIDVSDYKNYETLQRYPSLNHRLTLAQFTGIHEDLLFPASLQSVARRLQGKPIVVKLKYLTSEQTVAAHNLGLLRKEPADVETDIDTREFAGKINELAKQLPGSYRVIVSLYLGLNGETEQNFEEIAKMYSLNRADVHRIFQNGIIKLRNLVRTKMPEVAEQF